MRDPKYLYKFRSLAGMQMERVRSMIVDGMIYFSKPSAFNDPFDCLPRFSLEHTEAQLRAFASRTLRRTEPTLSRQARRRRSSDLLRSAEQRVSRANSVEEATALFERHKDRLGVLSLSERPDHVLLWSHCADSHSGVCLRFVATNHTEFFGPVREVQYAEVRPILNVITQSIKEQIAAALMTEAGFWAYEQEWRIFDFHRGPGSYPFPLELLDAVILGIRTSAEHEAAIRSWLKDRPHVKVVRATVSSLTFELEIPTMN